MSVTAKEMQMEIQVGLPFLHPNWSKPRHPRKRNANALVRQVKHTTGGLALLGPFVF